MYNYYQNNMLDRNSNPNFSNSNFYSNSNQGLYPEAQDDRFFLAPFLFGGLAGTALGYGIANNNQFNNQGQCCGQPMVFIPQQQPMFQQQSIYQQPQPFNFSSTNSNNFYY